MDLNKPLQALQLQTDDDDDMLALGSPIIG